MQREHDRDKIVVIEKEEKEKLFHMLYFSLALCCIYYPTISYRMSLNPDSNTLNLLGHLRTFSFYYFYLILSAKCNKITNFLAAQLVCKDYKEQLLINQENVNNS